jgi:quinohemoprotein ethanol dehydrogenase
MAFNPKTALVYIPAQEIPMSYAPVKNYERMPIGWNVGTATTNLPNVKGYLVAWDPVRQKEAWRANYLGPWNGGILTSAGNLVVQGNAAGDSQSGVYYGIGRWPISEYQKLGLTSLG